MLLLTAAGKLVGAFEWGQSTAISDALLSFATVRQLLVCAALIEISVALYIRYAQSDLNRALSVLWLCLLLAIYRLGLWSIGFQGYCKCLGYWSSSVHLSERSANAAALVRQCQETTFTTCQRDK